MCISTAEPTFKQKTTAIDTQNVTIDVLQEEIPKSQILDFSGEGDTPDMTTTSIFISQWLATKKGLT